MQITTWAAAAAAAVFAGNEYQQCGLVAPDEQPQPGTQAAAAQAAAAAAQGSSSSRGTDGLLAAAAAAMAKAAGMPGAAANGASSSSRRRLQPSDTNGAAPGACDTSYNYSSVYGVLPAARDILVPRCCMPGLAVKQVRGAARCNVFCMSIWHCGHHSAQKQYACLARLLKWYLGFYQALPLQWQQQQRQQE
jgi:hypothetical protein